MGLLIVACSNSNNKEQDISNNQSIENTIEFESHIFEQTSTTDQGSTTIAELDEIDIVCQMVKRIDFTIKAPVMNISLEEDVIYRDIYLKTLKNEVLIIDSDGQEKYFRDLYKVGTEFEQLRSYYSYYYTDLDGDEAPELGIKSNGYTYILKYDMENNKMSVHFREATMYITILGTGQLWYHDGLHAGLSRDEFIVFINDEWKTLIKFEQGVNPPEFFCISIDEYVNIDIGENNWNKVTLPFFNVTKSPLPSQSFEEVFGKLQ